MTLSYFSHPHYVKLTAWVLTAVSVLAISSCAPRAAVVEGPPPAEPVVYDASAFDVFQAAFEIVSTAPGVPGWEGPKQRSIFGNVTREVTYGGSGSWVILQSDRAAGYLRAETTNVGAIYNPSAGINMGQDKVTHNLTLNVSGPDESGPTQVVAAVSSQRSSFMIQHLLDALDERFSRR